MNDEAGGKLYFLSWSTGTDACHKLLRHLMFLALIVIMILIRLSVYSRSRCFFHLTAYTTAVQGCTSHNDWPNCISDSSIFTVYS